jgi:hypothetical protein
VEYKIDNEKGTAMPHDIPGDSCGYISKWDRFVLKPLIGTQHTLSRNNGRQIARDSEGRCFLLIEKDHQALWLGLASGPGAVGQDVAMIELAGSSPEAIFPVRGPLTAGSMVLDREGRLHIVWCDNGTLLYTTRSVKKTSLDQLRQRADWSNLKSLAGPPCDLGDLFLDASGKPAVCYCCHDTVFYLPLGGGKPEVAGGAGAGMPPLVMPEVTRNEPVKHFDPAAPPVETKKPSYPPPLPIEQRESRQAVMDLGPDGSVHLAFQREFDIWYARRTPEGRWLPPEHAAWGLAFFPAIIVTESGPLICFQYEGLRKVQLGGEDYLATREGGGASIGFAVRGAHGWRTDYVAKAEEIIVNRQGIWQDRFKGKLLPMVEEMWRPVLFRDRHGVAWALWQNTTRRWAYCARWMGEEFGEVQECRGPFNAPGQPVGAEKLMSAGASEVGLLFFAANRVMFDRMKIPGLSLAENREVLFLDSLEIARTQGLRFEAGQMTKHPDNPIFSPGPLGSKDDRHVFCGRISKHGTTYVMTYQYQSWADSSWNIGALAISEDGLHWRRVEQLPSDLPPAENDFYSMDPVERSYFDMPASEFFCSKSASDPVERGYFDNPDLSDPAKKYMRIDPVGPVWHQGSKRITYSSDGKHWTPGPKIPILNAIYECGMPNLYDPLDNPERRIKIYGRAFSSNSRSCGMMWSKDMIHWEGAEHYLDPDDPYGTPPANTSQGALRGQIFLDACAGKGEDQIYYPHIHIVEGLYMCIYWPCSFEHRYEGALAVSRDGVNFTRVKNGSRALPVGPAGAWDSGIVKMGWPQRQGDNLVVYYGGGAWHHGTEPYFPAWHIGLATIRVNGWTCYTPTPEEEKGTLTTIPIDAPAGSKKLLTVNIERPVCASATFKVEVLDAATRQTLPGFTEADCIIPETNGIAVPVTWKGGPAIPTGKPIRLRFVLSGTGVRLYSFGFKKV